MREVLHALLPQATVSARNGRWRLCGAHTSYRTQDDRIDGVVITFVDISAGKALEAALREALLMLQTTFRRSQRNG
jgi:two-component system CheB/CheR fusion protein